MRRPKYFNFFSKFGVLESRVTIVELGPTQIQPTRRGGAGLFGFDESQVCDGVQTGSPTIDSPLPSLAFFLDSRERDRGHKGRVFKCSSVDT